jgi:hypothetical protein
VNCGIVCPRSDADSWRKQTFLLGGDQGVAFQFGPICRHALNVTVESFPMLDRQFGLDDDTHHHSPCSLGVVGDGIDALRCTVFMVVLLDSQVTRSRILMARM